MGSIVLEVRSRDNEVTTPYKKLFETIKMSGVTTNKNPLNSTTVTEAGDTANQMSEWVFKTGIGQEIYEGRILYWALSFNGNVRVVNIYSNSALSYLVATGSATIVNGANAVVNIKGVNDFNLSGSVRVTIGGGGGTVDADSGNTLTFTNVTNTRDLQLPGVVEFGYLNNREVNNKYTVTETLEQIEAMINNPAVQDIYAVTFRVVEEVGGTPISGVEVTFNGSMVVTSEDGLAVFTATDGVYAYAVEPATIYSDAFGTLEVNGANVIEIVQLVIPA